jgi:hypothetical protein
MLYQAILFVVAKSALAHRSHDNPKIELSGSAPKQISSLADFQPVEQWTKAQQGRLER